MNNKIKVSVIVPVYKVEKYIEKCVRSLFEQTLNDIEFIFIDDCGGDRSFEIIDEVLKEFPKRKETVKIIYHKFNKGSFTARITGINNANGEYIIHCDSDDWVEADMYEKLYDTAKKEDADVVWCDFIDEFSDKSNYRKEKNITTPEILIKDILRGINHGALWNKLVRKELYTENDIYPLEGINIWEDLYISVNLLLHAKRIAYVNQGLYHYNQQNVGSLLSSLTMRKIEDRIKICNGLKDVFVNQSVLDKYYCSLKQRQLWAKMEFITDKRFRDFDKWRELYPEAKSEIFNSIISVFNKVTLFLISRKYDMLGLILLHTKELILKSTHLLMK